MKDSLKLKKKVRKFLKKKADNPIQQDPQLEVPAVIEDSEAPRTQEQIVIRIPVLQRIQDFFKKLPPLPPFPRLSFKRNKANEIPSSETPDSKIVFTKPTISDFFLLFIPAFLLIVLFSLMFLNNHYLQMLSENKLLTFDEQTPVHPYPIVATKPLIDVTAKAAIVVEADSQVPLFEKNPNLRFSMASTTKIMTALTALQYFKKDSVITVKPGWVEGSQMGLQAGEHYYFGDLLYAMLLPSANDAAQTIAANYPGGVPAFVQKMNANAAMLHLKDTHYADPTGLDDDGDYTTVVDMARLASYAIKNKDLTSVTSTKEKIITDIGQTREFTLYNLNQLLGFYGVTGIKTGTTAGAGEVLVTSAVEKGHTYIIVVMNSQQRFVDTQALLDFVINNVSFITPQEQPSL